ncbi:MAG TPA: glycoside hydrolase family 3 C-terminal domain-containing protein [Pyrinomonadaceae bacterium]|nr:glycoside hydrolase family 3 C-terminal domain-containing protein [Pyrinomonadaceae bacterium]
MKKLLTWAFTVSIVTTSVPLPQAQTATPQLGKNSVKEVVAAMTIEEKAKLLVGLGLGVEIPDFPSPSEEAKKLPERVPGAAGRTYPIPRLGIPSITLADGPAGVRINPTRENSDKTFHATGFPIATLLASSWDTDLVNRVGAAFGSEAHDYGIDILLAPGMNIQRNPLGGRNFEYYSEDPLVTGKMAASFVRGVQSKGVGVSIKHLAANNQEFNRRQSNSLVGERALREIYLRGFEIAVKESQPWTVMSSYNLINGTFTSESRDLLTDVLRGDWGFQGFVMSDWFGGNDPVLQMKAGNDLLMPGLVHQTEAIVKAVADRSLSIEQLDANVERVLNVILQTLSFRNSKYSEQPDLKTHAQVARMAASEGMVLLKNDNNALPLAGVSKVALLGNSAYDLVAGGTGSGDVNKKYVISLDQGLSSAGLTFDESLKLTYTQFIAAEKAKRPRLPWFLLPPPIPEMPVGIDRVRQLANEADVAIITVGRNSGEFSDRNVDNDFTLAANEREFIENVSQVFHSQRKKVIAVLNVGGPIEIASWRAHVDAILLAWQPGQEAGNAIADVLMGKVNPSGKLATTFPVHYSDVPSATTFPGKELVGKPPLARGPFSGKPAEAVYHEGIYVGYRYYNTFDVKPAYEFGYGLSYTSFSYGEPTLSSKKFGDKLTLNLAVKNTGRVAGREVVQVYVSAPQQRSKKPQSELKAFAKTRMLQPGESQRLTFTLSARDLASYDPSCSCWLAEAGSYTVNVAASSLDVKGTAKFDVAKDLVVEKTKSRIPRVDVKELEPPSASSRGPRD